MPLSPERRYKEAVAQASQERGIGRQTEYLRNRCKQDAGVLWHLFETYFDERVRADLEKSRSLRKPAVALNVVSEAGRVLRSVQVKRGSNSEGLQDAIDSTMRRMKLWTFKINGKPLAETSVKEAHQWLVSHNRDGSFVRKTIAGLPPSSARPIGYFHKGIDGAQEVERFYAEAEAERRASL